MNTSRAILGYCRAAIRLLFDRQIAVNRHAIVVGLRASGWPRSGSIRAQLVAGSLDIRRAVRAQRRGAAACADSLKWFSVSRLPFEAHLPMMSAVFWSYPVAVLAFAVLPRRTAARYGVVLLTATAAVVASRASLTTVACSRPHWPS
jgi:hypothetical protein